MGTQARPLELVLTRAEAFERPDREKTDRALAPVKPEPMGEVTVGTRRELLVRMDQEGPLQPANWKQC